MQSFRRDHQVSALLKDDLPQAILVAWLARLWYNLEHQHRPSYQPVFGKAYRLDSPTNAIFPRPVSKGDETLKRSTGLAFLGLLLVAASLEIISDIFAQVVGRD
jgi:hypothetical protein